MRSTGNAILALACGVVAQHTAQVSWESAFGFFIVLWAFFEFERRARE